MKGYKTVAGEVSAETEVKHSRFIATVCPCKTEEEATEFIARMRKKYWDATHNVYAFSVRENNVKRFSDDGEPQGTAGLPILNVLKNKGFYNVAVVVTRYFGGVKLGAGGLIRAYSEAAAGACNNAKVTKCVLCSKFSVEFSYENYKIFTNFKMPKYSKTLSIEYSDKVRICFVVRKEDGDKFVSDFEDFYNKSQAIERLNDIIHEFEEV